MCLTNSPAKAAQRANLGQYYPLQKPEPQKTYVTPLSISEELCVQYSPRNIDLHLRNWLRPCIKQQDFLSAVGRSVFHHYPDMPMKSDESKHFVPSWVLSSILRTAPALTSLITLGQNAIPLTSDIFNRKLPGGTVFRSR